MSADDLDSPWKEAVTFYLQSIFKVCFPDAWKEIDWNKPVEFLDTEFQRVLPESNQGRQFVDKLAKVSLINGTKSIVYLHIEVQQQRDEEFRERMFNYFIRLSAHLGHRVASFAILADDNPNWRPDSFETNLLGCRCLFDFPTCKLIDLAQDQEKLLHSSEAAAIIILANRLAQQTKGNPQDRYGARLRLFLELYEKGIDIQELQKQMRLISWMMKLPVELNKTFYQELKQITEERNMPYMMEFELEAMEKGKRISLQQSIFRALGRRGTIPPDLKKLIEEETNLDRLQNGLDLAYESKDIATFQQRF